MRGIDIVAQSLRRKAHLTIGHAMKKRHSRNDEKNNQLQDGDMTKKAADKAQARANRKVANQQVNTSVKKMYDDIVGEPVPDGMTSGMTDDPAEET